MLLRRAQLFLLVLDAFLGGVLPAQSKLALNLRLLLAPLLFLAKPPLVLRARDLHRRPLLVLAAWLPLPRVFRR